MGQPATGVAGFREVDERGNPQAPEAGTPADAGNRPGGPRINPYIAVLWAVSAALLAGGAWWISAGISNSGPITGPAPALTYLAISMAPQAIAAGLAIAVVLLFWHAHQWRRRHG